MSDNICCRILILINLYLLWLDAGKISVLQNCMKHHLLKLLKYKKRNGQRRVLVNRITQVLRLQGAASLPSTFIARFTKIYSVHFKIKDIGGRLSI